MTQKIKVHKDKWNKEILIQITVFDLLVILGNLDLALRHPENIGVSSVHTKELGRIFYNILLDEAGEIVPDEVKTVYDVTFGR